MLKKLLLIATALVLLSKLHAQAVKVGEICPTLDISGLQDFAASNESSASIKHKLIIIDFWSTNCSVCIKGFPKMEKLQRRFGDTVKIVMVTEDHQEKIDHFFDIHPKIKRPMLPSIVGDTQIKKLFPYNGALPQHVWIDGLRKVVAITSGESTTEENIGKYLAKNTVNLRQKKSVSRNWQYPDIPTNDSNYFQRVRYYSYIIPSIDSFSSYSYAEKLNGDSRFNHRMYCNSPAMPMYLDAFNEGGKYKLRMEDILLEVKDPYRFIIPQDGNLMDDWNQKNTFIYDVRVPSSDNIYSVMKEDLHRFFKVDAQIETRDTDCIIITRSGDISGLLTKGGASKITMPKDGKDGMYRVQNFPFQSLIGRFQVFARSGKCFLPVIDETGIRGNVDFEFPLTLMDEFDLVTFQSALQRFGLSFKTRKGPRPFLVLKEKRSE